MIGLVLKDQYLIKEFVAEGGMSMVYRAYCKKTDRDVAIKVLKPEYYHDVNYVKGFRKEVQSSFKLHHKNIISVIDVGAQDGLMYMVMDFVEGETLKRRIEEQGCISVEECIHIGKRICMALQHAHLRGLIHRDLKPQNIMMTLDNEPMLMDFGIAHDAFKAEDTAQNALVMGSVKYISPEQARNAKIDKRSDLYSLGIMLYEMATGEVPFQGEDDMTIALKHIHQAPEPPKEHNDNIPESLNRIILKAISKEPDRRYKSAYEMFQDLSRSLEQPDGEYVNYRAEDEDETERKEIAGNKKRYLGVIALLAAVLAIIAAAVLIFSQIFGGQGGRINEITVPSAVGMTEQNAINMLKEAKFKTQVFYQQGDEAQEGLVIRQTPAGGEKAQEDDTVQIIVCVEGEPVKMPELVGIPIDQASQILRRLGLNNISLKYKTGEGNLNEVIDQEPKAGEEVQAVQSIELTLLEPGQESPGIVNVPKLINLPLNQAIASAEAAGFSRVFIYEEEGEQENAGKVVAQTPNESVSEPPGGDITLWSVQRGEPNLTALYSGEIKEAEEGSTIRITVGYPDFANAEIILYESKVEDKKLFSQTMEQGVVLSVYHVLEQDTITEQVNLYLNDQLIRTDQIVFAKE